MLFISDFTGWTFLIWKRNLRCSTIWNFFSNNMMSQVDLQWVSENVGTLKSLYKITSGIRSTWNTRKFVLKLGSHCPGISLCIWKYSKIWSNFELNTSVPRIQYKGYLTCIHYTQRMQPYFEVDCDALCGLVHSKFL
jgi:hypothetical protein